LIKVAAYLHSLRDHPPNLMRLVPTQGSLKHFVIDDKGRVEIPFYHRYCLSMRVA